MWYRLLEPVRQYALQQTTARGEVAATRARHAAYYLALAERAAPALRGPQQDAWLARLEREQGNLRAALGWAEERGRGKSGCGWRRRSSPFWEAHGHLAEGRRWLPWRWRRRPTAVHRRCGCGRWPGGPPRPFARRVRRGGAAARRESGAGAGMADAHGIAAALTELGMVARRQRDYARSVAFIEEGLARYRALGDETGIALALLNLGATLGTAGDAAGAVPLLTESLTRFEALGDLRSIATLQAVLGAALPTRAIWRQRPSSLLASLTGHARLGDPWHVTSSLLVLVGIQMHRERWEAAARLLGAAQALGERVSSAHDDTYDYAGLGAAIQAHLDAEHFTAAWTDGYALTFDQAVAAALALAVPPSSPPSRPARLSSPARELLTRREQEIARLVAQGKSDREIAATLFISVGTVSIHVHHIRQKLGLHSRWQIADRLAVQDSAAPPHSR